MATKLAKAFSFPHLDLDEVTWASSGVRKEFDLSLREVNEFIESNKNWIIEGCYGSLIKEVAHYCTELHFLNPSIEVCLKNNLSRPWEPHKYESEEAQNKNFKMLQKWVKEYETREDEYSLQYHYKIFDDFEGKKFEHTGAREH